MPKEKKTFKKHFIIQPSHKESKKVQKKKKEKKKPIKHFKRLESIKPKTECFNF